jgi:hypothetical protein
MASKGAKSKYDYKSDNYLDIDALMEKYAPLKKSIFRLFSRYNNLWVSTDEYDDLHQQIDLEFVRLCREYDPTVGVDFPGYIKSHLQQRVYHYITKLQNSRKREGVVFSVDNDGEQEDSIDFNNISTQMVDEKSDKDFRRVEALANFHIEEVPEIYHSVIKGVLYEHKSLDDIAKKEGVTLIAMQLRFTAACDYLIADYSAREQYYMYISKHPFIYTRVPFITRVVFINRVSIHIKRVPFVVRTPIIIMED